VFQITRLKIDSNPFAKGFRDSGRIRYDICFTICTSTRRGEEGRVGRVCIHRDPKVGLKRI
jgi:hypothetical protein